MVYGITKIGFITDGNTLPNRSLDFEKDSSQYLSMSSADFGSFNRNKLAFGFSAKRESLSGGLRAHTVWAKGLTVNQNCFKMGFDTSERFEFALSTVGTSYDLVAITNATYTSTSTWYNFYCTFDSSLSASEKLKVYLDGTRITSFNLYDGNPSGAIFASTDSVTLGLSESAGYYDGLIHQPFMFSGIIPDVSQIYSGGVPRGVKNMTGLWSLNYTTEDSNIVDDYIRTANWTNVNGVTKSTEVP